jgi:hypothetical protein
MNENQTEHFRPLVARPCGCWIGEQHSCPLDPRATEARIIRETHDAWLDELATGKPVEGGVLGWLSRRADDLEDLPASMRRYH